MKNKAICVMCFFIHISLSFAQFEATEVYDRVAGPDSLKALQNLVLLDQNMLNADYISAYDNYHFLIEHTPYAGIGVYKEGEELLIQLIASSSNIEIKRKYFDELMRLYDIRINNAKGLNSFCRPKDITYPGTFLFRKAFFYSYLGKNIFKDFSFQKVYSNYKKAETSIKSGDVACIDYYAIQDFFTLSYQNFKMNPSKHKQYFIDDFIFCVEECKKMFDKSEDVSRYKDVYHWMQIIFKNTEMSADEKLIAKLKEKNVIEQSILNLKIGNPPPPIIPSFLAEDKDVDEKSVFEVVEIQPEFPGGRDALMRYIDNNLIYPSRAKENNIQGRCVIKFIVTKFGGIQKAQIVKSLDPDCDKEAIRVIMAMPKWHPGRQSGKPVNCYFTTPVLFRLNQ